MHGGYYICRKKDSACMTCMCLSPEAEDFLHSPDNFCTLLPSYSGYTHSPKVFNKNDELHSKINHRQFYCFGFI